MYAKKTEIKQVFSKRDYLHLDKNALAEIIIPSGTSSSKKNISIVKKSKNKNVVILEKEKLLKNDFGKYHLIAGNKVTLLIDGPTTYNSMVESIKNAKHHVNFETFVFEDDVVGRKFADLLLQKNAEGVQIRLIYDSLGSIKTPFAFFRRLTDNGIQICEFNPVSPFRSKWLKWNFFPRDHRKILAIDGKIAFTGGINIGNDYSPLFCGYHAEYQKGRHMKHCWRDTHIKIEGPAAAEFEQLFEVHFAKSGKHALKEAFGKKLKERKNSLISVINSSPGMANRGTYLMYLSAIANAKKTVYITNSYFVPNKHIIKALTDAARRGVNVTLLLPKAIDSLLPYYAGRSFYTHLLKSGITIYEFRIDTILHAKTAVIDGIWSTVGSTNFDFMSLYRNDEVNVVILDYGFAKEMERMFLDDIKHSNQVTLKEWKKRNFMDRIKEFLSALFTSWI